MKRSITTFLIIAVAALLVVLLIMGVDSWRQQKQQDALAAQIIKAAQALEKTPRPPPDLEQRLAAAQTEQINTRGTLPQNLNSTRVIDAILKKADTCQVKAIPLSTKPWTKGNIVEGYYVFRLTMTVLGTFPQLTDFVSQLESGEFETLVVESMEVSRAAASPDDTAPVTAHLGVAVYAPLTAIDQGAKP